MSNRDCKNIADTAIGKLSDSYIEKYLKITPSTKTYEGIGDDHTELDDPDYQADANLLLDQKYLKKVKSISTETSSENLAKNVIKQSLENSIEIQKTKVLFGIWGAEESHVSNQVSLIEYTAKNFEKENLIERLAKLPKNLDKWFDSITQASNDGIVNSKKSTQGMIKYLEQLYRDQKYLNILKDSFGENPTYLEEQIARKADRANYYLAERLRYNYLPFAKNEIGVGLENYHLISKQELGIEIDLVTSYQEVKEELIAIKQEIEKISKLIDPSTNNVRTVIAKLDAISNKNTRQDVMNFLEKMQFSSLEILSTLIPNRAVKFCGINLTEDPLVENPHYLPYFSDENYGEFVIPLSQAKQTWRVPSTFYHETVPGHHLQFVMQLKREKRLTSFQKTLGYNPGFEEGWAFYIEKLISETIGYQNPAHQLSYLLDRALRLARLELDIAIHLNGEETKIPKVDFKSAVERLKEFYQDEKSAIYEVNRYLAIPAQATAYQIGAKLIEENITSKKGSNSKKIVELLSKGSRPLSLL